jgi:putative hydrolase of the HAD superfamily
VTEPAPIRALVVDYGGVLTVPIKMAFDAWLDAEQVSREAFTELIEEWRGDPGNPMHQLETGAISGDAFALELAARLRRRDGGGVSAAGLNERIFAGLAIDYDAFVMLRAARSAGLKTALLSNSWDFEYPWADLDPLLDVKIVSGEVGLRKPDPAIYAMAGERLGVPLAQCVFVDDIEANIEAARSLGMYGVLHTDLPATLSALVARVPALAPYLPDLPDLPDLSEPGVPDAPPASDSPRPHPQPGG